MGIYGPPTIYDFNFFSANRNFKAVLQLQEQYVT